MNTKTTNLSPLEMYELGLLSEADYLKQLGKDSPKDRVLNEFSVQFLKNLKNAQPLIEPEKKGLKPIFIEQSENHTAQSESSKKTSENPEQNHPNNFKFNSQPFNSPLSSFSEKDYSLKGYKGTTFTDKATAGLSFGKGATSKGVLNSAKDFLDDISEKTGFSAAVAKLGTLFGGASGAAMSAYVNTDTAWCARLMSKELNDVSKSMFGQPLLPNFDSVAALLVLFTKNGAFETPTHALKEGHLYPGQVVFFDRKGPGEHVGHINDVMQKDGKTYVQVNQGNYGGKAVSDNKWREIVRTESGYFVAGLTGGGTPLPLLGFGNTEKLVSQKFDDQVAAKAQHKPTHSDELKQAAASLTKNHNYDLTEAPSKAKASKQLGS